MPGQAAGLWRASLPARVCAGTLSALGLITCSEHTDSETATPIKHVIIDGHPGGGKWTLFEAFVKHVIELAQSNQEQWAGTAILITVDESGGYYDSGFIQWVDFFGTGPRIPMIAVSPFSTGGHVSHVYSEHSSFVKFIERNWKLPGSLSERSRDGLPNPLQDTANPYVPRNMPAIGDLFDLFQFP